MKRTQSPISCCMRPLRVIRPQCWLVGSQPTTDWTGHAGELACLQSGNWVFVVPKNGMRVLDESVGQELLYIDGWQSADDIAAASGGSVVDAEARTAINGLIAVLISSGILPQP